MVDSPCTDSASLKRYNESFNGKLRDELLNGEIFYSLAEAKVLIEQWRREYNTVRPHSAWGGLYLLSKTGGSHTEMEPMKKARRSKKRQEERAQRAAGVVLIVLFGLLVVHGCTRGDDREIQAALDLEEQGDFAEAARLFRELADQENAEAQYALGYRYDAGIGVLEDDAEALRLISLSAAQGYAPAQRSIALRYATGGQVAWVRGTLYSRTCGLTWPRSTEAILHSTTGPTSSCP